MQARAKVLTSVNTAMVQSYWHVGKLIVQAQGGEERAVFGDELIKSISKRLTNEFGKGFDASNLRNMRLFYLTFPNCDAVRHNLSWTHYRTLMRVSNPQAREYYAKEAAEGNWSTRQLERQIATQYYERLLSTHRDSEEVESLISKNLPARPEKYPDLVFYNVLTRSYVIIDLKMKRVDYSDIGQMQLYVNYYNREICRPDDNPTIGIILCSEKNDTIVEYTLGDRNDIGVFSAKYDLIMPTKEELSREIELTRQKFKLING